MNILIEHIQYLLVGHDCVVVPGVGALLAANTSARYDEARRMFMPPQRLVGFNPEIRHADGMLAASISRREGMPIQQAQTHVDNAVRELRTQLQAVGQVTLGSIGTLQLTAEGLLEFQPSPMGLRTPDLAYLQPVEAVPLAEMVNDDEAVVTATSVVTERPARRNNGWRIAASVAVLLAVGLTLTTPMPVDHKTTEATTAITPTVSRPTVYNVPQAEIADMPQMVIYANMQDGCIAIDTLARRQYRQSRNMANGGNYAVIVASMPDAAGANKFIAQHPGHGLRMVEQDGGKFRVYAATAATMQQAYQLSQTAEFRQAFPQSWVTRLR